jgi:hypothetical protein
VRRLLVPRIDHAKVMPATSRIDSVKMPSMQGKDLPNPLSLERPHQHFDTIDLRLRSAPLVTLDLLNLGFVRAPF